MRIFAILLVAGLTGCGWGQPALKVEMNGRTVLFKEFVEGKVPKGVEVTRFDGNSITVTGREPIVVNGIPVLVTGDEIQVGERQFIVDADAKVLVLEDGQIEINVPSGPVPDATKP